MFQRFDRMRSMRVLAVTAALAAGCGSSSNKNKTDAGPADAGLDAGSDASTTDASVDAGQDGGGPIACTPSADAGTDAGGGDGGVLSCDSKKIATFELPACCAHTGCGLNVSTLSQFTNNLFQGCVGTNQPSVPAGHPVSDSCSALWASLSAKDGGVADAGSTDGGAGTVGWTITVGNMPITFPGCCRLTAQGKGQCGFRADTILGQDLGFGCLPLADFKNAFPDTATFNHVESIAVCDPATGEMPTSDAGVGDAGTDGGP